MDGPDIAKADLFRSLGYGADGSAYEAVLEAEGLSNPRKARIATAKTDAVARLLAERFMRVCARGDCNARARTLATGREITLAASQDFCEICGGSINREAIDRMVGACAAAGWTRLCVVGGSPHSRQELEQLVAGRMEIRFVDGTRTQTLKRASADIDWADRVVVWGGTQLDHKVSTLYTGRSPNVVTAPRRGVADLAQAVLDSIAAEQGRGRPGRRG